MPIIEPVKTFYSVSVWKRFGKPNGFGEVVCGWSQFGDDDDRAAVYNRRIKRGNFWTKENKIKKGRIHCKLKYYYPPISNTPSQSINRSKFAQCVHEWQNLTESEKYYYNELARGKPLSGYNIYIKKRLKELL